MGSSIGEGPDADGVDLRCLALSRQVPLERFLHAFTNKHAGFPINFTDMLRAID